MAETNDMVSGIRSLIQSELMDVNTSINAVVVSYANGVATVRPTANKLFADGDSLPFPDIVNVPMRWPSFNGGVCGMKGPVRAGDKVLVVFSQQATDGSDDVRRFDLSDAYAMPVANDIQGQAGDNDSMVMWFGDAYIRLTADGKLEVNAPGGTVVTAPTNDFSGSTTIAGTAAIAGLTKLDGGFNSTGTATNNGKDIGSNHLHSLVRTGTDPSGPPV